MKYSRYFQILILICVNGIFIFIGYMKLRLRPLILYRTGYVPSINVQRMHIMLSYYRVQHAKQSILELNPSPYCFDTFLSDYSKEIIQSIDPDKTDMYEYYQISQGKKHEVEYKDKPMTILKTMNASSIIKDSSYISLGIATSEKENHWYFTFSEMKCIQVIPYHNDVITWFKTLTNSSIELSSL